MLIINNMLNIKIVKINSITEINAYDGKNNIPEGLSWYFGSLFISSVTTASIIGNIIAVEAVLLIHNERNAVTNMNPSNSHLGLEPKSIRTLRAILSCNLQTSIELATTKPPKNNFLKKYNFYESKHCGKIITYHNNIFKITNCDLFCWTYAECRKKNYW